MNGGALYALGGTGLLAIGAWALVLRPHLLHKILALNVMASGAFLILVGSGATEGRETDPVSQAIVITGIVVSISATALGLALVLRLAKTTGHAALPEDRASAARETD